MIQIPTPLRFAGISVSTVRTKTRVFLAMEPCCTPEKLISLACSNTHDRKDPGATKDTEYIFGLRLVGDGLVPRFSIPWTVLVHTLFSSHCVTHLSSSRYQSRSSSLASLPLSSAVPVIFSNGVYASCVPSLEEIFKF